MMGNIGRYWVNNENTRVMNEICLTIKITKKSNNNNKVNNNVNNKDTRTTSIMLFWCLSY